MAAGWGRGFHPGGGVESTLRDVMRYVLNVKTTSLNSFYVVSSVECRFSTYYFPKCETSAQNIAVTQTQTDQTGKENQRKSYYIVVNRAYK